MFLKTRFGKRSFNKKIESVEWKLKLNDNGFATLAVEPINLDEFDKAIIEINNAQSVKQLKVGKSYVLETVSIIVGYIYFVAWMIALYPLLIRYDQLNYANSFN